MDFVMNIAARSCEFWWGLALAPQFYYPLASTSLSDFWGRRWNLTQGLVLKHYVYQPVVEGRWVTAPAAACVKDNPASAAAALASPPPPPASCDATSDGIKVTSSVSPGSTPSPAAPAAAVEEDNSKAAQVAASGTLAPLAVATPPAPATAAAGPKATPGAVPFPPAAAAVVVAAKIPPRWRRNVAVCLTFLVSGLEHEVYRWYITNRIGYEWLLFFTLQGPVMALEKPLKRRARALGFELHPWVSPLAVLMVLNVMADLWFWPAVTDKVVVGRCISALRADAVVVGKWMGC
jgi:hypothetical protein